MSWYTLALGGLAIATGAAGQKTLVTEVDHGGNHAVIIQSGPTNGKDDKAAVEIRREQGYVVIEQHNKTNRAVIMQNE